MRLAHVLPVLLLVATGTTQAGRLELTNGAVIPGSFDRLEGDKVVWNADLIGEIRVQQTDVARLDSPVDSRIRVGNDDLPEDCALRADGAALTVTCADRAPLTASWEDVGRAGRSREGSGRITASLTRERGNSFSDEYEVDASAKWRRDNLRHNLDASLDYEERRSGKTEDEATLDYQLDYVFPSNWYLYGRSEYDRDRFGAVQESLILGAGIGRTWTFFSNLNLLVQAGPDFGRFDLQQAGRVKEGGGNMQWRADHELTLWRWDITLFHRGEYGWLFRDSQYSRLETQSGVEIPLSFGVIAELRLDYDRSGIDPPNTDDTDTEWVLALGYKW